jgi:pimeloyl-ACP methyl ester carboxylesterase
VTNGSTKIYWEESGAGDPLLLIMGLGYSLEMWHRTRPLVAARFRTIVFDNRGVGRSDVPAEAMDDRRHGRRRGRGARRRGRAAVPTCSEFRWVE